MTLPQQHYSGLHADDVVSIIKLCNCTVQNFEIIGNLFMNKFSKKCSVLSLGSALVIALGEHNMRTKLRQRLVLLYLIYKVNDLDIPPSEISKRSKEEILENLQYHPFLSFLLFLMGGENALGSAASQFNSTFAHIALLPQERYLLGLLLTGRCDEVSKRSPIQFAEMVIHQEEVFDLRWLMTTLKSQQASYSSLAKASMPAFLRISDESKNPENVDDLEASLVDTLINRRMSDIFPPPFYRFVPTLMPPSDDEFQFLYPFLLEPLWMDAESLKGDIGFDGIPKTAVSDNTSGKSKNNDNAQLRTLPSLNMETSSLSNNEKKMGTSLPNSPKTSVSIGIDDGTRSTRAASVCSLPPNLASPQVVEIKCSEDSSFAKESPFIPISLADSGKLLKEEAVQLINKALRGVIARHDTQRLADAIAADPTIADCVEILPNYFPKLINDNPTVAAAIIFERVKKNSSELPTFFEMLTRMNPCVQGMEVVNKLCSQVDCPQEYLNRFISSCVQRCDDPNLASSALCRQVRVICVFLSSLMRNKTWNVHPLSVELQSFALKYSYVREAASLYQAILLAMQSEIPKGESEVHAALKAV